MSAPCSAADAWRGQDADATPERNRTVYLRGGTYRLANASELGTADSAENGYQTPDLAYPREVPVLSGAQQVTGWSLYNTPLCV